MQVKKKYLLISVLILIAGVLSVTFGFFGTEVVNTLINLTSVTTGTIELTLSDEQVNATNLAPIYDQYYAVQAYTKTFTVTNTEGSINACTNIYLDISSISESLKSEYFKYKIVSSDNKSSEGNFSSASTTENMLLLASGFFTGNQTKSYTLYIWISYQEDVNQISMLGTSMSASLIVEGSDVKQKLTCEP